MPGLSYNLLIIGNVWPEPLATAAGKRMLRLINSFKDFGSKISFGSAAAKTEYSLDLAGHGVTEIPIALNDPGFDSMIKELGPDIVVFDRFMTEEQYGWRVAENLPSCLRILNTEDLHSLRNVRGQMHKENKPFQLDGWLQSETTKRELASIYRSDLSLVISPFEMHILKERANIPSEQLFYLPFIFDGQSSQEEGSILHFDRRSDFIFVGNGKHLPNVDAILWLHKEIWPQIHNVLPETKLHIYGAYLPEKVKELHQPGSGFLVHGWTENSDSEVRKARVNLVPLRFGAGIKGKLVEAMSCGTPSVSTSIGWEGLPVNEDQAVYSVDDAYEFAKKAVGLYTDPSEWLHQHKAQKAIFKNAFGNTDHANIFHGRVRELMANLEAHRLNNIVGSLLLHHTTASTKYLSKWIEAKNKTGKTK